MKKSFGALFIIFSQVLTFGCKGRVTPSKPEEITTGTITGIENIKFLKGL